MKKYIINLISKFILKVKLIKLLGYILRSCEYNITFLKSLESLNFAKLNNFSNLLIIKLEKCACTVNIKLIQQLFY